MEKEYVQSGLITNLLKSLPKFIGKGIEQVSKMGVNITESKPVDGNYDNGVIFVATGGKGHIIKCKVVPVPELKVDSIFTSSPKMVIKLAGRLSRKIKWTTRSPNF